jgi:hypothetical protein
MRFVGGSAFRHGRPTVANRPDRPCHGGPRPATGQVRPLESEQADVAPMASSAWAAAILDESAVVLDEQKPPWCRLPPSDDEACRRKP